MLYIKHSLIWGHWTSGSGASMMLPVTNLMIRKDNVKLGPARKCKWNTATVLSTQQQFSKCNSWRCWGKGISEFIPLQFDWHKITVALLGFLQARPSFQSLVAIQKDQWQDQNEHHLHISHDLEVDKAWCRDSLHPIAIFTNPLEMSHCLRI